MPSDNPHPAALADLIQRLTEATGPSREIDADIARALGCEVEIIRVPAGHPIFKDGGGLEFMKKDGNKIGIPPWTASTDVALTLAGDRTIAVLLAALAKAAAFFSSFRDKEGHIKRALPRFICIEALRSRDQQP